jgi:serine protease inhibitor
MQYSRFNSSSKALVAAVLALIVCSNVPLTGGAVQNQVDSRLTAASIRFSFNLYNEVLKQQKNKNTFISPASAMLALAMTYNGADGTTRQAMARALEIDGMSVDEVNRAFADLKSALAPADPKIQLKIANSLWASDRFTLNPAFVKRNEQHFAAEIASLDFSDPSAAGAINSWVDKNTEGKIRKILEEIKSDAVLFLINAIYFKAAWKFEFKKDNTRNDVFRLPGGEQKQLPMMSQSGSYFYHKTKDFQSIALPYGNGRVSMYLFLPDEQSSLDHFQQNLTTENWETWMRSFRPSPGDLMLPRFKVEWESQLKDELIALGMGEAFNPARANFSQIAQANSGKALFISEVMQKTWCEVNEEGTTAAAVTSVVVSVTSAQEPREKFTMKVDRPFFFAIRDNQTGVVLFMGSITDPG